MHDWTSATRPNLVEVGLGIISFQIILVLVALAVGGLAPGEPGWQGVIGSYGGGVAGLGAFAIAYLIRRQGFSAYGFTQVDLGWFVIAAALAIMGYACSVVILQELSGWSTGSADDPQVILHAAARGGAVLFLLSFIGGALLTPLGEELLFRGVVANALNRFGMWAGVGLSSVIFGVAHVVGVILPIAIMMGLFSAILFRMTGSIWPSVALHSLYNGLHTLGSALQG